MRRRPLLLLPGHRLRDRGLPPPWPLLTRLALRRRPIGPAHPLERGLLLPPASYLLLGEVAGSPARAESVLQKSAPTPWASSSIC